MENELDHVIALIGQTEQEADQIAEGDWQDKGCCSGVLRKADRGN